MTVVGVLLAAGAGRRYGAPKVLAHQGLWLTTAVEALRGGGCDRVLVVLGAADVPVPAGAEAVHASDWRAGMSASLRAGLTAAATDPNARYAAIHLVDIPDVDAAVVARVIDAATGALDGIARAEYDGRPGHPVVLARHHWQPVLAGAAGDEGARSYLQRRRATTVAVPCADLATGTDHDRPR